MDDKKDPNAMTGFTFPGIRRNQEKLESWVIVSSFLETKQKNIVSKSHPTSRFNIFLFFIFRDSL